MARQDRTRLLYAKGIEASLVVGNTMFFFVAVLHGVPMERFDDVIVEHQ
jgi:hypothetical protein